MIQHDGTTPIHLKSKSKFSSDLERVQVGRTTRVGNHISRVFGLGPNCRLQYLDLLALLAPHIVLQLKTTHYGAHLLRKATSCVLGSASEALASELRG